MADGTMKQAAIDKLPPFRPKSYLFWFMPKPSNLSYSPSIQKMVGLSESGPTVSLC
jgi:hypothetical protein